MAVINRKIDDQIITELNTGSVAIGTAAVIPSIDTVQWGQTKLQNASIPWDGYITLLAQPSLLSYLEQAPEFSKAVFVDVKPFSGGDSNANWRDTPTAYRWKNMLVIAHPNLPSKGTTSEKSFMYHRNSMGHAADKDTLESTVDRNQEQDYSWARASMFMGAKLLQNSGVVVITGDGSARA